MSWQHVMGAHVVMPHMLCSPFDACGHKGPGVGAAEALREVGVHDALQTPHSVCRRVLPRALDMRAPGGQEGGGVIWF